NPKSPFSAEYRSCHALVSGPVPARNAATSLTRIRVMPVRGPTARQKLRRMIALVSHRSPRVRQNVTYFVTRASMFTAGPPGRGRPRRAAPPDRPWHKRGWTPGTGVRGGRRSLSETALVTAGGWHRHASTHAGRNEARSGPARGADRRRGGPGSHG